MITLYNSIATVLENIESLRYIDIDGDGDKKIYPAVYVKLGTLDYPEDYDQESTEPAKLPFTLKVLHRPLHSSGKDSPVRDKLCESFSFIDDIKKTLLSNETELIHNINITKEDVKRDKEIYTYIIDFIGVVYSE
jgi:hypothetical protein